MPSKYFVHFVCLVNIVLLTSSAVLPEKPIASAQSTDTTSITFHIQRGGRLYFSYPLNIIQFKQVILDNVMQDSSFTITITAKAPFTLFSQHKSRIPYLFYPGYNYTAEIKAGESIIDFKCRDKLKENECNALKDVTAATIGFDLNFEKNVKKYTSQSGQYDRPLDSFLLSLKNQRGELLDKYHNAGRLSDEGYRLLYAYIYYDFIAKRLIPFYYTTFDPGKVPGWYADTMRQYQHAFDDSSLLSLYSFQGALIYYHRYAATDTKSGSSSLGSQFEVARNFKGPGPVRNYLFYQVLNHGPNKEEKEYPMYVDSFKLACSDTLYNKVIQQNFDLLVKERTLSAGTSQLFTLHGNLLDFDSLISRQKKLIYIDCWASWCAPCKSEMPASARLQKEYAGKNITFLFFSLDEIATKWETGVSDYDFMNKDNNFLVAGNFKSPFVMKHRISSIPRYILMRNDGKIIDANAPRPGDPKLKELINRSL